MERSINERDITIHREVIQGKNEQHRKEGTSRNKAEEEIKESEKSYRAIFNAVNDAIFVHDMKTGRILDVNKKMCEMYGYTPEEAYKVKIEALSSGISPYDQKNAILHISKAAKGEPQIFEWHAKDKKGNLFWVEVNLRKAVIGKQDCIIAVVRDITERKRAEDRLRFFSSMVEQSSEGMAIADIEGNLLFVNQAWSRMHGYEEAEKLIGQNLKIFHTQDQLLKEVIPFNKEAMEKGFYRGEVGHKHREGTTFPTQMVATLLKDEKGNIIAMSGLALDITERKQAEKALRESEERFRTMMEQSPTSIQIMTPDGWTVQVNDAYLKLWGLTPKVMQQVYSEYNMLKDEQAKRLGIMPYIERAFAGEAISLPPFEYDALETTRTGGRKRWIQSYIYPVKDKNGEIQNLFMMHEDITERKRAEEALASSEEFLNNVFEQNSVSMWISDSEGTLIKMNQSCRELFGSTDEEAVGKYNLFKDNLIEEQGFIPLIENVFEKGEIARFALDYDLSRVEHVKVNGATHRILDVIISPIKDMHGKVTNAIVQHKDITERKQAQDALFAEKERLGVTLRSIGDGTIVTDENGKIEMVNKIAERLTGWHQQEAMGKPLDEVFCIINEKTRKPCENPVEKVIKTGRIIGLANDTVLIARDGTEKIIADSAAPIRDRDGNIIGVILVFRDVTEKKKAEDALQKAHDELEIRVQERTAKLLKANELLKREIDERKWAEQALRESEKRFRDLTESTSDWIWEVNENAEYTYASPVIEDLLGYKPEEIIGKTPFDLMSKEESQSIGRIFAEIVKNREPLFHLENTNLHKDGHLVWLETSGVPFFDDAGNFRGYRGIDRDITERKKIEEELKRIEWLINTKSVQEEIYKPSYGDLTEINTARLILDSVGENTLVNIAGDYLDLLETSSAIYEKNGDYALGIFSSGWCQFLDKASRCLCDTENNREALDSGKWLCHESCWAKASKASIAKGKPVDIKCVGGIRLFAVPIRVGQEIVGSINFGYGDPPRDIHILQKIAKKFKVDLDTLIEQARKYKSRPKFIIEIAKSRLISSAKLIGGIIERKKAEEGLNKYRETLEEKVEERTGQLKNVIKLLQVEIDKHKKAEEELKRKMAELVKTKNELEAVNKELDSFTYTASHDLKEPLRGIKTFSGFLLEEYQDKLDDTGKNYLKRISASTVRLKNLIDDLLALSRISRIKNPLISADSGKIVRNVIRRLEPILEERNVRIDIDDELPFISCDPIKITEVFYNLISNAIKYNDKQKPVLEIGFVKSKTKKPGTTFFVRDNGIGIKKDYFDKIFKIFRRLHARTEYGGGTGAGLAIVQKIIQEHRGKIWVESEEGKGSTFYFMIPK